MACSALYSSQKAVLNNSMQCHDSSMCMLSMPIIIIIVTAVYRAIKITDIFIVIIIIIATTSAPLLFLLLLLLPDCQCQMSNNAEH